MWRSNHRTPISLRPYEMAPMKLRRALWRSSLNDFWLLIKAGAYIDSRDRLGRTLLHLVIYWKKELPVVKAVLSAGADPNASDHQGLTPLHAAVISSAAVPIVKALLSAGADLERPDGQGRTPLMNIIHKKGNIPIVRELLSAGADIETANLLVKTVEAKPDHELLRLFLHAGASVNDSAGHGYPPIVFGVLNGDPIVVKMLLSAGASVDFYYPNGKTLLHQVNSAEITRDLIRHGLEVNAADRDGETPLHRAVVRNSLEVVRTLIEAGADVHAVVPRKGNTCLHLAKTAPVINELVSRGVDINARNRLGEIPLHYSVFHTSFFLPPAMRVQGLFVRFFKDGNSPRMIDMILAVNEMIKHGADVNAIDWNGRSIIESVVTQGHSKMADLLINCGVEVYWKRLFCLNVINENAMQILIRESLIGNVNVKGEDLFACKDENGQPILQFMKPLLYYANRCLAEIALMKKSKVNCNNTIHHIVLKIAPEIRPLKLCSHCSLSNEQLSAMFPIYRELVADRLNVCYARGILLDILENVDVHAFIPHEKRKVNLIYDCKFAIARFLSNRDLFNFVVAMGFNVCSL